MINTEHPGGLKAMSIPTRPGMVLIKPKDQPSFEVELIVLSAIVKEHGGGS